MFAVKIEVEGTESNFVGIFLSFHWQRKIENRVDRILFFLEICIRHGHNSYEMTSKERDKSSASLT